ncbi:MAG: START-like domain-containing protein [Bacteroidia bacterium]|nr:START-like domain-containing protein [Bacteroidia bacterium]
MLKEKFHIEFVMGSATQASLWRMISQIDGLSEWFADEVTMNEGENMYTFFWGKSDNRAEIVNSKPQQCIRFRWLDEEDETVYFEFQLHKLELSSEIALQITDFAEPDEKGDTIALWETQIDKMKRRLGIL